MKQAYFLLATLLLAGCASPYGIDVADAGQLPKPADPSLHVSPAADTLLTDRVMGVLTSQGFKVADPAGYLVQIVSSDVPGRTGLFLPEGAPDASGKQAWLTAPSRSKTTRTRRITVTFTDVATGKEVYRAFGDERYRAGDPGSSDALIDAVVGQIKGQEFTSTVQPEAGAR
jgi:hypothetical protein